MTLKQSLTRGGLLLSAMLCASSAFAASTEFVIHTFRHTAAPIVGGCSPRGELVADSAGNLYGAGSCGAFSFGTIFKLTRPVPPSTAWTSSVLYSFDDGADGAVPAGGLIFDVAGNLYGTTSAGGTTGLGTVFELSPPAAGLTDWTLTTLYNFQGSPNDGTTPLSGVVWDHSGHLVGVTQRGGGSGNGHCPVGCGIVYELSPPATAGGAWTETVLHYFSDAQGSYPVGAPVVGASGDVYGATSGGGRQNEGTVFRLTPPASGSSVWSFRVLHVFTGLDGVSPLGALTLHGKNVLYGTTQNGGGGGPCTQQGCGTVFQLVPPAVAGGTWTENVLHSFTSGNDGEQPQAKLLFDSAGNIYGTTPGGGAEGLSGGIVFELSPPAAGGSTWTETILHAFPYNAGDAFVPSGGLILGEHGVLFGGTQLGSGSNGQGAVYGVVK